PSAEGGRACAPAAPTGPAFPSPRRPPAAPSDRGRVPDGLYNAGSRDTDLPVIGGRPPVEREQLQVPREGPVVIATFNRPEARNALTWAMYERLEQVCEEVDAEPSVRALVLRGAGGRAFVAGAAHAPVPPLLPAPHP